MNTKSSMLSLILMHDDGEARSIRISKRGLWLLIILTILSPIAGLIGLWVGWEAWESMSNWQQEKLAYQIQIDELRVQLERFSTLEALLKRQDAALGSKVDNPQLQKENQEVPTGKKDNQKTIEENQRISKNSSSMSITNSLNSINQVSTSSPTYSLGFKEEGVQVADASWSDRKPHEGSKGVIQTTSATPSTEHANNMHSSAIGKNSNTTGEQSSFIDYGVVKVENVQRQIIQGKRIQAQISLFNTEKVPQLSGHVQFALITNDGKKYALSGSDTSFRITRFKSMFIDSELPVSDAIAQKSKLLIEVVSGDKVVFRQLYSLSEK